MDIFDLKIVKKDSSLDNLSGSGSLSVRLSQASNVFSIFEKIIYSFCGGRKTLMKVEHEVAIFDYLSASLMNQKVVEDRNKQQDKIKLSHKLEDNLVATLISCAVIIENRILNSFLKIVITNARPEQSLFEAGIPIRFNPKKNSFLNRRNHYHQSEGIKIGNLTFDLLGDAWEENEYFINNDSFNQHPTANEINIRENNIKSVQFTTKTLKQGLRSGANNKSLNAYQICSYLKKETNNCATSKLFSSHKNEKDVEISGFSSNFDLIRSTLMSNVSRKGGKI